MTTPFLWSTCSGAIGWYLLPFFALRVYQGEKEENDANFNYPEHNCPNTAQSREDQGKMTFELCIGNWTKYSKIDFNKGILLQKFHIAFLSFSLAPHCGIKGGADFILLPRLVRDLQRPLSHILAVFGQFGPFLGAPGPKLGAPPNSQLVWKSQHICPVTRSNFVPRRSNRSGPPEPSKSDFGHFWAIWALFGRPWAKIGGTPQHKTVRKSGHFADISSLNLQVLKISQYDPVQEIA